MAEIIELRRERLLPEYELMKKYNLFTEAEIRAIIKARDSFEHKINRQPKTMKDFIEYITYERALKTKVTDRMKEMNAGESMRSVESSMAHHIKNLYKQAVARFPAESRLWANYLKFCKHANFLSECSTAFEKMLQYHSSQPDIWLKAAMWEYQEMNNIDRAKDLFLRGLQRHPDNADLYIKFFAVMLEEASKMNNELILEGNTQSEQLIGLQRVEIVYQNARKKIIDCEFYVNLLEEATKYTFTKKMQKGILEFMMNTFPRDELLWHTLAQRELKGHHMVDLDKDEPPKREDADNGEGQLPVRRTLKARIELCVDVYKRAVHELKTERMWSYYITAMMELNADPSTQKDLKLKSLINAFRGAFDANFLSEYHCLQFIQLLLESTDNDDFILQVIEKAIAKYASCLKLWELWMRFYIGKNDEVKIREIFNTATKELGADAHPLWRLIILYYQTFPDKGDKVDEMFQKAARQTHPAFESYRADYLEWVALTKCMTSARKVYFEMATLPPPSLSLHQMMATLESIQIKPEIKSWRQCHEYATLYFGKVQTDVWTNYIKFERDHGEPKNMSALFERAKQTLSEELVDNFISEYSLLIAVI